MLYDYFSMYQYIIEVLKIIIYLHNRSIIIYLVFFFTSIVNSIYTKIINFCIEELKFIVEFLIKLFLINFFYII